MKSIIAIITILVLNTALSQSDYWKQTGGPYAGHINQIATASSGRIFVMAGTDEGNGSGLYYSENSGMKWTRINLPDFAPSYPDFAATVGVSPNGNIYISSVDGDTYMSSNGGNELTKINRPTYSILKWLCISDSELFVATYGGMFRSTDNGLSWVPSGSLEGPITSLARDSSGTIYVGTTAVDVQSGEQYLGRIYRSTDQGNSWSMIFAQPFVAVEALAAKTPGSVFVGTQLGIIRSIGADTIWSDFISSGPQCAVSSLMMDSSGNVYAGTNGNGIFRSKDKGVTWSSIGLSGKSVQVIGVDKGNCLFAGLNNEGGLYLSSDTGSSWTQRGMPITDIEALTLNRDGDIFAVAWGGGSPQGGIYKSVDRSANWSQVYNTLQSDVTAISCDSANNIYMSCGRVYISTDEGETWNLSTLPSSNIWALTTTSEGIVLAALDSSYIYRSADHGSTWTAIPINPAYNAQYNGFAVGKNGLVYARSSDGIVVSTNSGNSWSKITVPSSGVLSLCLNSSADIFIGTYQNGIWRSTDSGNTWAQKNNGLSNNWISTLTVNSIGYLLAGTMGSGVFLSKDNGENWTQLNGGLVDPYIRALVTDANGYAYAASASGGVCQSMESTVLSVNHQSTAIHSFFLQQNYPNPFNPKTTIDFSIPSRSWVSLRIYDLLGREITTLVNGTFEAGSHSVDWDGSSFASGVYIYRIQTNNSSLAKTMLLLK